MLFLNAEGLRFGNQSDLSPLLADALLSRGYFAITQGPFFKTQSVDAPYALDNAVAQPMPRGISTRSHRQSHHFLVDRRFPIR